MIALVRVDNRLIHGQILVAWAPHLRAGTLVVADDEAARSPLARAAMTLCLPPGLEASIEPIASVDWKALAASPRQVMVLVREVADLPRAQAAGLSPELARNVNLGSVHHALGRRQISPSVFLSKEELEILRRLGAAGFAIEVRAVPLDAALDLGEIERRFAAGGC